MTKLLIPDLLPTTQYMVEVRAVRNDSVSEWSPRSSIVTVSDSVLPLAPVNVTWAVSGDGFKGSWDTSSLNVNGEVISIVRYEIELTANSLTRILSAPQTTGSSVLFNLSFEENRSLFGSPQPTVGMRVRAVSNIDTKSDWTSILNASNPVPAAPPVVTATAGANQVALTWTAPADNDLIGYNVYFGSTKLTFVNATSWTFYTSGYVATVLTVKSVDKFNQLSAGADSNSVTPTSPSTVDTTAPNTPTAFAATITNNANGIGARAAVSWTMASPPSDLAGYYIRYRKVGDTNYSNTSFTKDVLAGTIELQSAYTNYEFQIKAYDWSNNESSWSATVTATSPANAAPSNITTLNSTPTSDSIVYTWTPSSDADLKNYEVTFSTSSTFASGNVTFYTGTSATLSVGGLTPSTTYYARVRAVDTSGLTSSSWSATNTTTTSSVVNSVKDYSVEYALSGSETVAPTTGWSTTAPTRTAGTFIWTRTVVTYQDNTTNTTSPALVTGNTGATGSNGTPAANVYLTATSQVLSAPAGGGATNPATTTVTGSAVNTTITSWTYSVDGAAFSATVPTGVSRTGNTVTITGVTMTAKTITIQMSDANGVADVLTVAKVSDGATGGTGGTGPAGADAYTVLLSNEAQTFTAGTANALAATATSTVIAYKGTTLQTATVGTITGGATGISAAVTNNGTTAPLITFTVTTALTTANGTFTIPITVGGMTFNQVFSWSLSFSGAAGSAGTPATSVEVGNDSVAIPVSTTGAALSAGSITIPFSGWIGTTRAAATVSTSALPAGITLGSNTAATTSADGALVLNYASGATIGAADAGSITLTVTCNGQSFTNIFSWSRAYTGATGGTGTSGTSATSLDTSPDVFMIPTNSSGAASAAGSVVVNFKGLVGSTASAVTIGTAPTLPAGITATPSGSGTTNAFITFSWANAATIGAAASGTFAWPLTINGISFTANIGWARAIQGAAGGTGATGKGITSITPYFLQQTSGGATPATPAVSPPAAPWTTTEPTYTTNTELWRTERIIYTDATFAYTTPTKVSSYAAAAQAITSASGKNTITYSTVAPVNGTNTGILGDTWFVRDATTLRIKAQYELTTAPSTWTSRLVDGIIIANLDAGRLTAGIITGQTIQVSNTGSIQSTDYVASSAGWKLSTTGLEINNGSVKASALTAGTLGSSTGVIQIGAGASIVMNGGYIKSNTNTGTTMATAVTSNTGFYLGNDGLFVGGGANGGQIKANALISDTLTSTTITLGTGGSIVGGSWTLNSSGLTIPNGAISAAALNVQIGNNLMPATYADFEAVSTYYPANLSSGTSATAAISTTQKFNNSQSMYITNAAGAARIFYLGASSTDYNIPLDPSSRYIISGYIYNTTGASITGTLGVAQQNGSSVNTGTLTFTNTAAWTRYSGVVTTTSAATSGLVTLTLNGNGTLYFDAIQIEKAINSTVTTPSAWTPPGATVIDGGMIRTGSIQSTALGIEWDAVNQTYVDGTQPAWSIGLDGSATLSNASVTGSLTIGNPSDPDNAGKYLIGSAFYQPGTAGWIMHGDGWVEFNQIVSNSIDGDSIRAGTLAVDKITAGNLGANVSVIGGGGIDIYTTTGIPGVDSPIITLSPEQGLLIDPPGDALIQVPADGSQVVLRGVSLGATDASFDGNVSITGTNNYISGDVLLENGVSDPTIAPTVVSGWSDPRTYFSTTPPSGYGTFGLTTHITGSYWVTAIHNAAAKNGQIWKIDQTTGVYTRVISNIIRTDTITYDAGGNHYTGYVTRGPSVLRGLGKIVVSATTYYAVLVYYAAQSGYVSATNVYGTSTVPISYSLPAIWQVKLFNAATADSGTTGTTPNVTWTWTPGAVSNPFLTSDGTYLYIAAANNASPYNFTVTRYAYNGTGATVVASTTAGGINTSMGGIYVGAADFGSTRYLLSGSQADIWSLTGVNTANDSATTFKKANNENVWGIYWDGTQFRSINGSGKIYKYSTSTDADTTRTFKYSWFDGDPAGTGAAGAAYHETLPSPPTAFTVLRRGWFKLTGIAPPDNGGPDDPDRLIIYADDMQQTTLAPGSTSYFASGFVTSPYSPVTGVSQFALLPQSGVFKSRAVDSVSGDPVIKLSGDGSWNLGRMSGNSDGGVTPYTAIIKLHDISTQSIPTTVWTGRALALYQTRGTDVDPCMTAVNSGVRIEQEGWYHAEGTVAIGSQASGRNLFRIILYANTTDASNGTGAAYIALSEVTGSTTGGSANPSHSGSGDFYATVGQHVRMDLYQNSGAAVTAYTSILTVRRI